MHATPPWLIWAGHCIQGAGCPTSTPHCPGRAHIHYPSLTPQSPPWPMACHSPCRKDGGSQPAMPPSKQGGACKNPEKTLESSLSPSQPSLPDSPAHCMHTAQIGELAWPSPPLFPTQASHAAKGPHLKNLQKPYISGHALWPLLCPPKCIHHALVGGWTWPAIPPCSTLSFPAPWGQP